MITRIAAILLACLISGCINGYSKFYMPAQSGEHERVSGRLLPAPTTPHVYAHSENADTDAKRLAEDGYVLLGTSSFYAPAHQVSTSQAVEQGKKVGASIVLVTSQYMDTVSGVVPYTTTTAPRTTTVTSTGTVSAYGSGGYATGNYSSTGTVTLPGTSSTQFLPYSIPRNTFFASYWAKRDLEKMPLGIQFLPLPNELRHQLQRNTGIYVWVVVRGAPAFRANILEGDVIVRINGEDVVDVPGFTSQLTRYAGTKVDLEIIRANEPRVVSLKLGQGS